MSGSPPRCTPPKAWRRQRSTTHYTSPARLTYDTLNNPSGGGWGGSEDPRAVSIEGRIYLTFNMFNGWDSMRVAFTSIDAQNLSRAQFMWSTFNYLSRPGERHKKLGALSRKNKRQICALS